MKNLGLLHKLLFIFNSVFALLLLLSYVLPYVFPKTFPTVSVLSLTVPILIIINLLFFIYWLIRLKKQLLLSLFVLLIGFSHVTSLYRFGGNADFSESDFTIMSYNVRLFNNFEQIKADSIGDKLVGFIADRDPSILCMQEFHRRKDVEGYRYKYKKLNSNKKSSGLAIYSKFPIIDAGSVNFPDTHNNAIYVDVVKADDTIRVYNVHLQSLKVIPDLDKIRKEDSKKLYGRIGNTFAMQQTQIELFNKHRKTSPYKTIICTDLNNTQYSNVYKQISEDAHDAFIKRGSGFGRTFNFKFFPVRIDFILADDSFETMAFDRFKIPYSDHYPVMAGFSIKE
ncbi:endonuclease/exonuclease/phosphatase family protein [Spongiivirga sp. MCCC 1A20706]|uniref:endonuclease/exonuclease/phosphatase family protein n=1 Tax=Spongiivirga sp. MCCC 1A20706 TaxID=3160963 RepID=UPI003977483C